MFPDMTNTEPSTTAQALIQFELLNNMVLPHLYRKFLLAVNGGRPVSKVFQIHGLPLNEFGEVNFLFGVGAEFPANDLSNVCAWFAGRIPPNFLPIADNGGVDYICLDLRGGLDKVVYWSHAHFWSTGEWRESDLYPIADSFEKFLNSLSLRRLQ